MYALDIWVPFSKIEMPSGLADALTECIEVWVCTQLYSALICRSKLDLEHDGFLFDQLASLAFVSPENLEIPKECWTNKQWVRSLSQASEELFTISKFKSPLQKLMAIQKSCQTVVDALTREGGGGADVLLPVLVWMLICSNPPQLYTSIKFISDFRNKTFKGTQLEYNLVSLQSAVEFVEKLTFSDLKGVSEESFEELKTKALRGEVKRWTMPPDPRDPLVKFMNGRAVPNGAVEPAEDWVVLNDATRPLFLWCPQMYNVAGLVEYLRFVYSSGSGKLILNCSDEMVAALPEIAIGAKCSKIALIVVGLKPVDWIASRKVRGEDSYQVVEQIIENFLAEKPAPVAQMAQTQQIQTPVQVQAIPPPVQVQAMPPQPILVPAVAAPMQLVLQPGVQVENGVLKMQQPPQVQPPPVFVAQTVERPVSQAPAPAPAPVPAVPAESVSVVAAVPEQPLISLDGPVAPLQEESPDTSATVPAGMDGLVL
jgi:hypothetical protein